MFRKLFSSNKNRYKRSTAKNTPKWDDVSESADSDVEYVKVLTPEHKANEVDLSDSHHDDDPDVILGLKNKKSETRTDKLTQQKMNVTKKPLIVVYLMAPEDQYYAGYELLQALLAVDLKFGKMNIFHRHADKNGQGPVLFSLASAVEPGTFDLAKMGACICPGLTFFLDPNKLDNPIAAYDLMWKTINQLADDLGGEVFDANRNSLNQEKILKIRQTIE